MYAERHKVLAMLHEKKLNIEEAEGLLDALEMRRDTPGPTMPKPELVGDSDWAQQFRRTIAKIAATQAPVLVQGEMGTGKMLIARSIHYNSPRANGPFVECSAEGETIAGELFGREDISPAEKGLLDMAHGGTLCIDLVRKLPADVQRDLHAFLRDGHFTRVGGSAPIYADVRIIGATHGDLKPFVERGEFRSDLYYRLSVCLLQSAPLRERREDIPTLTRHFTAVQAERDGRKPPRISPEVMQLFAEYEWPTNVSQLNQVMIKATALCDDGEIALRHLPELDTVQ